MNKPSITLLCFLLPVLSLLSFEQSYADDDTAALDAAAVERWGGSQHVFVAKLEAVVAGPVGKSFPPLYTHRLTLVAEQVLRGPLKKEQRIEASHVARQLAEPIFPQGKVCLVAATTTRSGLTINAIEEMTQKNLAAAKLACSIPAGWKVENGKIISPWASLGKAAWPEPAEEGLRCQVTGRPVLKVGEVATFTVAPVPPLKDIQWTNPDGDGEYRITVTNPSDKAIEVPALLSDDKEVLWAESLVITCQGRSYMVPGSKGVSKPVKPTRLEPGQSISTVVNVLKLQGPEWPRGGYRIEFHFCLGEVSTSQSFYYMSRHHDVLRSKLNEKSK